MDILKKEIIEIGKKLSQKNMAPGKSGNISVRYGDNFLITATQTSLGDLGIDDIILSDINGNIIQGSKPLTSEKNLHFNIYKIRKDINAIIHCHPNALTAFSVCHRPLVDPILSEMIYLFNQIPLAEYAMPSSDDLAFNTSKYFLDHNAVLMANHGFILGDTSLKEAFYSTESAESLAQISINACIIGNPTSISSDEVNKLRILRKKINSCEER